MKYLKNYKLITNAQYMFLNNPQFKGQTRPNNEGIYYMCWKSDEGLFKTQQKL